MPAGMAELARSCAVTVDTDVPLLSEELLSGLNPMSVTLMRADSMPPSYSGTPFKRPYEELSERCAPVHVSWSLLGASHTCAERPHAKAIVWNERHLLLAGARRSVKSEDTRRTALMTAFAEGHRRVMDEFFERPALARQRPPLLALEGSDAKVLGLG